MEEVVAVVVTMVMVDPRLAPSTAVLATVALNKFGLALAAVAMALAMVVAAGVMAVGAEPGLSPPAAR